MEHHILESLEPEMLRMQLYKKENNLEEKDNLDEIPEKAAVYAVCGRVNGFPANPRYVGTSKNLRNAVKSIFAANDCVGEFMNSIKLKELVYQVVDGSQLENKKRDWKARFEPKCTEVMNKVY